MTDKTPQESQRIDSQAVDPLLSCPDEDILAHPRVIAAYTGLECICRPKVANVLDPNGILPGNEVRMADWAFQMRDASCDKSGPRFVRHLAAVMASATPMPPTREGKLSWMVAVSTPAQWIKAAVLAWEERSAVTENHDSEAE